MSELTPSQAAEIAQGVYDLLERSASEIVDRGVTLGCEGMFSFNRNSGFSGQSGGLYVCKKLSGYGYIAEGIGSYQGQVLVATRGTRTGFDWTSNLNVGLQRGPGGHLVHAGFHEVWKSFSNELSRFLRGRNPSVIHCVGHSLGGALAALNADYFSSVRVAEVKLYTFGSPRTGDMMFARDLCHRVGEQNMYRAYHCADPVPMVPMFPFFHTPLVVPGYQLGNGLGGPFNPHAHGIDQGYIPNVRGQSWQSLKNRNLSNDRKMNVQLWLEQVNAGGGFIVKGSSWCMIMIARALTWLVDKAALVCVGGLISGMTVGMTALDYLAWLLGSGAKLSTEISSHLTTIIAAIFRFLGRTVVAGKSMTVAFIRWVLGLLYQSLAMVARCALSLVK